MRDSACFVIIDACPIQREGLFSILKGAGYSQCQWFSTIEEFDPSMCVKQTCTIVIMDFEVYISAREHIDRMRAVLCHLHLVLLTEDSSDMLSIETLSQVDGLFEKEIACGVLIKSLELIALGQSVFLGRSQERLLGQLVKDESETSMDAPPSVLSAREMQVLIRLAVGDSNKSIALQCGITEATVKVHVKAILRKIPAHNRTQAAIWARRAGILPKVPTQIHAA